MKNANGNHPDGRPWTHAEVAADLASGIPQLLHMGLSNYAAGSAALAWTYAEKALDEEQEAGE